MSQCPLSIVLCLWGKSFLFSSEHATLYEALPKQAKNKSENRGKKRYRSIKIEQSNRGTHDTEQEMTFTFTLCFFFTPDRITVTRVQNRANQFYCKDKEVWKRTNISSEDLIFTLVLNDNLSLREPEKHRNVWMPKWFNYSGTKVTSLYNINKCGFSKTTVECFGAMSNTAEWCYTPQWLTCCFAFCGMFTWVRSGIMCNATVINSFRPSTIKQTNISSQRPVTACAICSIVPISHCAILILFEASKGQTIQYFTMTREFIFLFLTLWW